MPEHNLEREEQHVSPLFIGGALALAGGAAALAMPHAAGASELPAQPQPQGQEIVVQPGDSGWKILDEHTDLTPAQIQSDLPALYQRNNLAYDATIHPGQHLWLPSFSTIANNPASHTLRYGEVLWTLVDQHYGKVTPSMVQAVASASGLRDMNHYYAGQNITFPDTLGVAPAPAIQAPVPKPAAALKPAPVPAISPEKPAPQPTPKPVLPMPKVTKETATWQAQKGPSVLSVIAIVSKMKNVPPETVAGWMRRANPDVNLLKLKNGQDVKLPGVSEKAFKDFGENLKHLSKVVAQIKAEQDKPAAPGLTHPQESAPLEGNYFQLPVAPHGEYALQNTDPNVRAGSKALIDGAYSVALEWFKAHPESRLNFGDLNAPEGHASHKNGIDIDISTVDKSAANINGDRQKSIELAKMLADTGLTDVIFYNDVAVQQAFNDYVKEHNLPGRMESWPNHDTHMHWRINGEYKLQTALGSPPLEPAPFSQPAAETPTATAEAQTSPRPPYTIDTNPLSKSGVTAEQIDQFLSEHAPAMAGLGKAFIEVENRYGINAIYTVAHAANESAWGTSQIARQKNNLFGRNAYDSSPLTSAITNNSYEASVLEYGAFLKNDYLTAPGQPGVPGAKEKPGVYFRGFSLKGVFDLYSTAQGHDQIIANLMNQIDPQIRAEQG